MSTLHFHKSTQLYLGLGDLHHKTLRKMCPGKITVYISLEINRQLLLVMTEPMCGRDPL